GRSAPRLRGRRGNRYPAAAASRSPASASRSPAAAAANRYAAAPRAPPDRPLWSTSAQTPGWLPAEQSLAALLTADQPLQQPATERHGYQQRANQRQRDGQPVRQQTIMTEHDARRRHHQQQRQIAKQC